MGLLFKKSMLFFGIVDMPIKLYKLPDSVNRVSDASDILHLISGF
jgi:hypothetical protein